MRRILGLGLLAGVLVLSVGISVAAAVTKVNSTEILDNGNLALSLEERGMKKFASVDYRLDATASAMSCDPTGQQSSRSSLKTSARRSRWHPMTRGLSLAR